MDRDQGLYQPYYPSQGLPNAQWDDNGQRPFLQGQQQSSHSGYQSTNPQANQPHQSYPEYQQQFQQPQYGYQTQPGFAASQQSQYQTRHPGQQQQPAFSPNQGQYFNAQSAGAPGRSAGPAQGWQPFPSTSMPAGPQNQRQPRSSHSRIPTSGSNSAYGGVGSSSDGPSAYHQSSGANSGISTPHSGALPSLSSGVSRLPAKPTFEPSVGAPLRQSPRTSIGAGLDGNSNAAGSSGVGTASAKPLSKSSLSMGRQLLDKLPPLPPIPVEPERPASLADLEPTEDPAPRRKSELTEHESGMPAIADGNQSEEAKETRRYLSSLLAVIEAYKAREDAMQMRMEALAFRPAESWKTISAEMSLLSKDRTTSFPRDNASSATEETKSEDQKETGDSLGPAPVLGVRLLRKVSELKKENEELGELLSLKHGLEQAEMPQGKQPEVSAKELEQTRAELEDAQQLLDKLSTALKASEARAERAERAMEATVQSKSVGVLN